MVRYVSHSGRKDCRALGFCDPTLGCGDVRVRSGRFALLFPGLARAREQHELKLIWFEAAAIFGKYESEPLRSGGLTTALFLPSCIRPDNPREFADRFVA